MGFASIVFNVKAKVRASLDFDTNENIKKT
jgi:hypothetical protein